MTTFTQQRAKELFEYHSDGYLIRKVSGSGRSNKAGDKVGHYAAKNLGQRNARYITTKINGEHWCVHKLIFLWHHGYVPEQLDHINRNTLDNRIENLRPATASQNASNRKLFSNSTSKAKGVSWVSYRNKWFVYVDINKTRKNIGYFDDFELAELVAIEAREKYHGAYANHS
jgi:hypothetical protein